MFSLRAAAFVLLLSLPIICAQQCLNYTTSGSQWTQYCSNALYPGYQFFLPAGAAIKDLDANFSSNGQLPTLFTAYPYVSDACKQAAEEFVCSGVYRTCSVVGGVAVATPACSSACIDFETICAADFAKYPQAQSAIPDCVNGTDAETGQPFAQSDCFDIFEYYNNSQPTFSPFVITCNPPLVPNPFVNNTNDTSHPTCFGTCCIPCPVLPYFYPVGWIDALDTTCTVISIISLFSSLFLVFSYSVLPHKRGYPSHIILNIGIALTIFYITIFFDVTPGIGRLRTQCETNLIDLASPGTSNPYAITQGIFVVYGILSAVLWYGFLVLNIFMSVVFLNTRMGEFPWVYHTINWSLPWLSVIIAASTHEIGYLGAGTWTITNNGWWTDGLMMIPIALIIFPSVILNGITLTRITLIGMRRKATYRQIIRLQLRPFLFVLTVLFVFLVYWIHYETSLRVTPNVNAFAPQWIACIQANGTTAQNDCTFIPLNPVYGMPNYGAYFFSEFVVDIIGVILMAFFGLRKDVIFGWWYYFAEGYDASFFASTGGPSASSQIRSAGKDDLSRQNIKSNDDLEKSGIPMDNISQKGNTNDEI